MGDGGTGPSDGSNGWLESSFEYRSICDHPLRGTQRLGLCGRILRFPFLLFGSWQVLSIFDCPQSPAVSLICMPIINFSNTCLGLPSLCFCCFFLFFFYGPPCLVIAIFVIVAFGFVFVGGARLFAAIYLIFIALNLRRLTLCFCFLAVRCHNLLSLFCLASILILEFQFAFRFLAFAQFSCLHSGLLVFWFSGLLVFWFFT